MPEAVPPHVWYELERRVKERWILDAVFDDMELAVAEAKELLKGGRMLSVRVVREGDSDHPRQVVFRGAEPEEFKRTVLRRRAFVQEQAIAGRRKRRERWASSAAGQGGGRSASAWSFPWIAAFVLACAVIAGVAWLAWGIRRPGEPDYVSATGGNPGPAIHWGGRRD